MKEDLSQYDLEDRVSINRTAKSPFGSFYHSQRQRFGLGYTICDLDQSFPNRSILARDSYTNIRQSSVLSAN